jgi:motility quorum-sensing regulator / GCU-specific mRNA interferase toxin
MEKRKPHCSLVKVQALLKVGKVRATGSALNSAACLGLDFDDMVMVVGNLTMQDFHKSMTTYGNNRVWQDVYHAPTKTGGIYVKLTVIDDVLIVSFKEL